MRPLSVHWTTETELPTFLVKCSPFIFAKYMIRMMEYLGLNYFAGLVFIQKQNPIPITLFYTNRGDTSFTAYVQLCKNLVL